ncbi:MAG: DNA (cytosine-5-)-methyltransferase [Anaerolineales bacterium]|nr:DNA (cytosine-5-)-methyltransferase [Anaerolineales bacterium]
MDFIDLFAGLGGFHIALSRLGHTCVFASEIDDVLRENYRENFGILPEGDIRLIPVESIPAHDILCAGFPCQPFSKAGSQKGFSCPQWGDLFDYVLRVIHQHQPAYVMLENVPNLIKHDGGRTWQMIRSQLENNEGYEVDFRQLSPHRFGIPQIRERVFIVASRAGLSSFSWPTESPEAETSILSILDDNPPEARGLTSQVVKCLEVWQKFLDLFPENEQLPSFPIWSMEFGATYPFEGTTPYAVGIEHLRKYRGSHGVALSHLDSETLWTSLPSYARTKQAVFPDWKIQFIRQNRELYSRHKEWLDGWITEVLQFPPSLQKFEWNCKGEERNIWQYVIQFRASGVRVKRTTTSPSLVSMTTTQVPIIAWQKRYMTPTEGARLQSLGNLRLPTASTHAFKALGNAVNARLVEAIAASLLDGKTPTRKLS